MSDWKVAPCLLTLRGEFNALSPARDKGADGTIGDAAHQSRASDHDPDANGWVKALDIDSSGPWPGHTFHEIVMWIVARCRSGQEGRIRYVIHERVIYHERDGFKGNAYTGSDPHTNHAHFSCNYTQSVFTQTQPWGVESQFGDDMPTADEIAKAVWNYPLNINVSGKGDADNQPAGGILRFGSSEHHQAIDAARAAGTGVTSLAASFSTFALADAKDDATKAAALKALQEAVTASGPAIVAAVAKAIPAGVQVTQDQLDAAFAAALRDAFSK